MDLLLAFLYFVRAVGAGRVRAAAENLALRQQLAILQRSVWRCLANLGIEEVLIAPRSPWQNPFVERLIDSIRRECLDHVIVLVERHLLRLLAAYFTYYHQARPHMALENNAPSHVK